VDGFAAPTTKRGGVGGGNPSGKSRYWTPDEHIRFLQAIEL
jgi:hypothetical protein